MRLGLVACLVLGAGCTRDRDSGGDDTGDSSAPFECPDPPAGDPEWSVLAGEVGDGVLLAAWSAGATVWMVGGDLDGGPGLIARYRDGDVCTEAAPTERALWWVHGTSARDWWAVGEAGTVLHQVDGVRTREDVATTATLFGVFDDGTDVWAVGGDVMGGTGEVWRRRDGTWSAFATDLPGVVFKVWDGFLVGDRVSYVIDGDELVAHDPGERLLTVRGRSASEVYAVGGSTAARVLEWNGAGWDRFDETGLFQPLNGVWTAPGEDLWVAGNFGTAAFWDGSAWQGAFPPVTDQHFHAVWKHCDEALFVGGNLFNAGGNVGTIGRYSVGTDPADVAACPP